ETKNKFLIYFMENPAFEEILGRFLSKQRTLDLDILYSKYSKINDNLDTELNFKDPEKNNIRLMTRKFREVPFAKKKFYSDIIKEKMNENSMSYAPISNICGFEEEKSCVEVFLNDEKASRLLRNSASMTNCKESNRTIDINQNLDNSDVESSGAEDDIIEMVEEQFVNKIGKKAVDISDPCCFLPKQIMQKIEINENNDPSGFMCWFE
ncbi:MAG: hypothetical protein MHMPM18_004628, partial [Marteilia pararefringens]